MLTTDPEQTADLREERFTLWLVSRRTWIYAIAAIAATCWTVLYLQFTVDDSYISFRYAKQAIAHHVWNWNPSGATVEAYTSATYTALAVVPVLLHLSVPLFFKFIGLLCLGAIFYRVVTVTRSPFSMLVAVLLLCLHPWVWLHAYSGLETPLYMLLILEMGLAVDKATETPPAYVYGLFLLLPLTRPEGIVFACLGLALYWYRRGSRPRQMGTFAAVILLGVVYFLARWHHFHQPLPNPFYVKISHAGLRNTLNWLQTNLNDYKGYVLILVLAGAFARNTACRAFALCALVLTLGLFAPHIMAMNYADRFYFQLALPIVVLFLMLEEPIRVQRFGVVLAAASLFAVTLAQIRPNLTAYPCLRRSHEDLGRRLAPFAANHTLLLGDAGAVPYFSDWVTYDFIGLATNRIAREGLTVDLIRELHPDLILVYSPAPGPGILDQTDLAFGGESQQVVTRFLRESSDYSYAGASHWMDFYLVSFLRKDTHSTTPSSSRLMRIRPHQAARISLSSRCCCNSMFPGSARGRV